MDDRQICDYFVIAGLPDKSKRLNKTDHKHQHRFNNNSQSPQHKKNQNDLSPPITDITIIIPSEGEVVPEDYHCIEFTPTGYKADLNSGSLKTPAIFLCYRRGTDKPPLTDIGVCYDSKDMLMNDSKKVETTYYGRSGNVNNGNSIIYLTYRRSKPDAPCNQLVVTDICVILNNKGETPPHAFNLIQKNLNKGFIGDYVYICYKKSMNSPPLLRYTPSIIDRYPLEDLDCYPLPESIAMFCLPVGSTIECWPKENTKVLPLLSTFVLTSNSGSKVYGVALTFYENFPLDELDTLSNAELKQLGYFSGFEQINKKLVVNKAICILSRWPFFDVFEGFLNYLYKSVFRSFKKPLNLPLEVYISHFMMNIPFPSIQRPKIRIQLSQLEEDQLTLSNPFEETPLPLSGASFTCFLQTLGSENCMNVFMFTLIEQKILLHSLRLDVLTSVAEALTSLIFPFHWQCPYIPSTPLSLCDVLNAPLPILIGVDSRYFDNEIPPSDVICIDLDTHSIYMSETKRILNIKLAPKKAYKNLKKSLDNIASRLNKTMLEMKQEKPSISFSQLTKKLEKKFNIEIQEAFLQFMTFILKDFRNYLMPIEKQPSIDSTDPNSLFDFKGFLMSKEKSQHQFYNLLMNTQLFTRFIEERTFFSDKYTREINASLAFFDECLNQIESTENADFSKLHLIELDDRNKNDRTVFISDPESLVNSSNYRQVYKYNKFGPFDHRLFLKEPILSHFENYNRKLSVESRSFENIGSQFHQNNSSSNSNLQYQNSTSSPMIMKRTPYEVKSAQKTAKRLAETPLTWAKCLISYCYSLWFVHLHSYVRANQQVSLKSKLKVAFNVLLRMQSLDLHPLDEICYRINMLLACVYNQPVLAVQILHEMKKNNVKPNAITYMYYSKAVLESEFGWKRNQDLNGENLFWKKLRYLIQIVAEFRRLGKLNAERRLKDTNIQSNLLKRHENLINDSSALLSSAILLDKHDSLFGRQLSKSNSFREKRLSKNKLLFNEELSQKSSSIVKGNLLNQFSNCNSVNHSKEAGLLINSQIYQLRVKNKKKVFDRKRHKSEEQKSSQSSFNLAKIKEELMNISSVGLQSSTDLMNMSRKFFIRSQSLSTYKQDDNLSNLKNELFNYKTTLGQPTSTPSNTSSQVEGNQDITNDKSEVSTNCSDEHISKSNNLQSMESLNSESSTFSPLKDAIKNMNPFFSENKVASTLRSSFRFAKTFSKSQFANSSLFKSSLTKQHSVEPESNTLKSKDTQAENGLSNESLNDKNVTKCNMTRSSTLPLSISSTASNDESESSKKSNLSIENENLQAIDNQIATETMTKSHSNNDFNSIWSTKFNTNKHIDYLNSTFKFATTRLSEIKSSLSSTPNFNSPGKAGQTQLNSSQSTSNNNALFTNLGQNTSALLTNFANMVADKLPDKLPNVGPISEYMYDYVNDTFDGVNTENQSKQQTESSDNFFNTLEQQYQSSKDLDVTTDVTPILKIEITSCTKCYNCSAILYDEEIMGEWSADDSNLNTTCRYCEKLFVPKLTIKIKYNTKLNDKEEKNLANFDSPSSNNQERLRVEENELNFEDYKKLSLAYLSPIVLRKELENVVDSEGDFCLTNPQFTSDHDIIYWNLVWYFKRVQLPTHLTGLYLNQFLREFLKDKPEEQNLDFRNVVVDCLWDNEDLYTDIPKPLYYFWRKSYSRDEEQSTLVSALITEKTNNTNKQLFNLILDHIYKDDLISAVRIFLHKRKMIKNNPKYVYSIYRDLLFLLFSACDRNKIDHMAFDRVYRYAYDQLTDEETKLMRSTDKPPSLRAIFCRRSFCHLNLKLSQTTTPKIVHMFNGNMVGNNALAEQARTLLDFNQRLDINLLDSVVECMYNGKGDEQSSAEKILTTFKEHPDAWTKVDTILEFSNKQQTKYYALQILENLIKSRWNALPRNQCEGIKKYIVSLIIKTSSDAETMEREKVYLNKLNMILVQILKCEWPKKWPSFISDIVGSSKTNESLCQNNMIILKLLSEEVFDFSSGQMTQQKAKYLKDTMCSEFSQIFTLCQFVLDNSQNPQLLKCTLETLLRFLNWIPLGYIFETRLISTLIFKFFTVPIFRNVALKCLTEIASISTERYDDVLINMFAQIGHQLEQMLPQNTSIKEAYANGNDDEQKFVQNLALFLCTFLKEHGYKLENDQHSDVLIGSLNGLLLISEVEDIEIFKICLEYWNYLVSNLYYTFHNSTYNQDRNSYPIKHRELYQTILTKLRYIMIARMAKPEEVLVVENDQGEVVREFMRDTDSIQLYKNMRETLVFLTNLDCADTERIMTEKLQNQVNNTEWSWKNVNTLCWAIGSISGAMNEDDERRFLVIVIKDLLGLCEQKRGKDNKAIIASNIMYVVGQYPRFLRAHWKFLKTVVNKLFEFMHETHEGVQDMACDTFIKIAQKCRRHFVMVQAGEARPFIEEILDNINSIICDLQQQQVQTFYEAVGYMISSQSEEVLQERLIQEYMSLPNAVWDDLMAQAMKNVEILKDPDAVRQLGNILKTNVRACKALGQPYVLQLGRIYLDMLNVYKVISVNITAAIQINGESVTKQPLIRSMRTVKKETLNLISSWISRATEMDVVLKSFIPPLLDAVLIDYKSCTVPSAREAEVLSTITTIVSKLEFMITHKIPEIFDAIFECTLNMINKDFQEYPEHRTNFYLMLQQVVNYCFSALLTIPAEQFKLVLDSIIWAFKHTMRNVADTGLQILLTLLENISHDESAMQSFYQTYYTDILQHLFDVITDSSHTSGLTLQASILAYMFLTIESGKMSAPLNPSVQTLSNQSNVQYVQEFVANLLKSAFSHLTEKQIQITVQGFFNLDQDIAAFKEHLRDFLVQIREYSGEDNSDLFLEEREASLRKAEEEKRRLIIQVPGILNPYSQISEEMQD